MAIKVFHAGQAGAPSLRGQNGSLITVLDAVLVNGYNSVSISGITRSGSVATVTTATAHGLASGDSALVAGAAQADYNVEAVVSVIDSTHFSYTVANSPTTPATGVMTVMRAPAGFDKAFSGTNKAAYRSKDVTGSRPYLQIIDDGSTAGAAKEAKTRGYLSMTDVDTGIEPFPTPAQYAAGPFTHKSNTSDATNRPWVLITDGKTIYFQTCMDQSPTSMQASGGWLWWLSFGDIISTRPLDPYTAFIHINNLANGQTNSSNGNGLMGPAIRTANPTGLHAYVVRSFSQVIGAVVAAPLGHGWDQSAIGSLAIYPYPHPPDNGFLMTPLMCVQGGVVRGRMPGVYEPLQGRVLDQFSIIEDVDGYAGRKFMALWGQHGGTTGMVMFDITGDGNGKWS